MFRADWAWVYRVLHPRRRGILLRVGRDALPDPRSAGAVRSIGWARGQLADFRFPPDEGCEGLHVQVFADRYEAHIDRVHPACDFWAHLGADLLPVLVGQVKLPDEADG